MKKSAEQFLVCPDCRGALILTIEEMSKSRADEIVRGEMTCKQCPRRVPIVRGIPRFVSEQTSTEIDVHTGERFADSWKSFSRLVDDRYEQQFFDWMAPVTKAFVKDKLVLDAGCGKGRHSYIVSQSGARTVFAVDIGEAIDVAYNNIGGLSNVHVIQADINHLPFNNVFDYVYSNGVLHHMADPAAGFSSLVKRMKPGGAISVWVYGAENNWWVTGIVNPIRTGITCKMPVPALKFLSLVLALILYAVCRGIYRPWMAIQSRIPLLPSLYYQEYLGYISNFDLTELHNIVFDHLVAPVAYYLDEGQVRSWFIDNGFRDFSLRWHNKNSWAGFGQSMAPSSAQDSRLSATVAAVN